MFRDTFPVVVSMFENEDNTDVKYTVGPTFIRHKAAGLLLNIRWHKCSSSSSDLFAEMYLPFKAQYEHLRLISVSKFTL